MKSYSIVIISKENKVISGEDKHFSIQIQNVDEETSAIKSNQQIMYFTAKQFEFIIGAVNTIAYDTQPGRFIAKQFIKE